MIRYRVDSLGRAGRAALITDVRTNEIVLELSGPDQWSLADAITDLLNTSRTETPIRRRT